MKRVIAQIVAIVLLTTLLMQVANAQGRICNPFTTTPDSGMLATGTVVQFVYYEAGGPVRKTGTVEAYYIQACFPGVPIIGLDSQAYVVNYGSADGSRVVLNRSALSVQ